MALIKIKLTEDMVKLLPHLQSKQFKECVGVSLNKEDNILGGTFVTETVAMILDKYDSECVEKSKNDWDGRKFNDDFTDYAFELYDYLRDNLVWIENIVHTFCVKGVKAGEYKCKDYELLWEYSPLNNEN